jgi:hypothetical protein
MNNNNNNTVLAGHVYPLGLQEMHTEFRLGNILKKLYLGDRNRNEVIILT